MTIIRLMDHPSNIDPTAFLTTHSVPPHTDQVYRVRGGFMAVLPEYQCLSGLFPTEDDARQAIKQIAAARDLSDGELRRHASIATDNGPFDENDTSFTTACEHVRRERGLPPLHEDR